MCEAHTFQRVIMTQPTVCVPSGTRRTEKHQESVHHGQVAWPRSAELGG